MKDSVQAEILLAEDLLASGAFDANMDDKIRTATAPQLPSSITRGYSSVSSNMMMDSDPMATRMMRILNQASGSTPGSPHSQRPKSDAQSQSRAEILLG